MIKMNNITCPCKRTKCERYGNCDECRAYHHNKNSGKTLTRCEKLENKEQKRAAKQRKRER